MMPSQARTGGDDSLHRWYLGVGAAALVGGALLPPAVRVWVYVALAASLVVAVAVGVRRHRPVWPATWWLMAGAVAMSLLAQVGWALAMGPTGVPRFPSVGDACYLIMLVLTASSIYWWVRPAERRGGAVDAGIVALGAGAVLWTLVVAPMLFNGRFTGLRLGSYVLYAGLDLLILVLTVRVVVISRVRTPAYRLMVVAAGLLVATDTTNYVLLLAGTSHDTLTALGWLGVYLLLGGAALHPSMARSTGSMPANPSPASRRRLATYVSLTVGVSALSIVSFAAALPASQSARLIVPGILGAAMSVLLIVRLSQLATLLNRRTHLDGLTGLGSRVVLQDRLDEVSPQHRVLLLVDLDGFRDFNDAFGHQAGDAILVETGARVRAQVPTNATVVRLSADEFAVCAPAADDDRDGSNMAERILAAVHRPYRVRGLAARRFGASIGAVALPAGQPCAPALRDADLALRVARTGGGDQVAVFDPAVHAERLANAELVAQMHHAVEAGEFEVHYQPIIDLATGDVAAAEALLRWTRPDGTRIPPDRFIPLAEQGGAITTIGAWVLRQVCTDLRRLWSEHQVAVTVNVSAHQLRDPLFAAHLLSLLDTSAVPGRALIVEITETVLVTSVADAATVTAQLQQLREHGVRIAIDDFGTGYSSLAYLRELPVDILKMDGSFTAHQIDNGGTREIAFIRAILDLSRSLGLVTIAEAVETDTQAHRLRALDCNLAQGYHFAKPGPVADLHTLLHKHSRPAPVTAGP
ncbi:diguanylate cyclase (GGDEF)-like protein [Krasilnikovia cinnamomea]|uniref:Diguanylate cyclase (GGDEF)-like protein n=2 Tax=Krasilnikovia cinnamomea TaxID=349313 RepID=A0A4Q7ZSY4_9ACTN|nr:diguanylate cyclase (GGDEF)-like protein [Krasilnikovia cinnamomea]